MSAPSTPTTEIRSLLLTDVVDSTRLAQELGDAAMADVWRAHDRVARELLVSWRGREIDKTDGMLLLFEHPADAVGYALAYHRALAALRVPLAARAGLHVGPVILRDNDAADVARGAKPVEVEGLAKPIAARVAGLAQARQTLLTTEAREQLGDTSLVVVSHGHWVLKGVAEPIELFEVGETGTPFTTPPDGDKAHRVVRTNDWWLPVRDIANNLPFQATSFIGRERERGEVKQLLSSTARLVTLLGMGGIGKTRLSLQVAAESLHRFPDGAWFIDLGPISDPALVVGETARVVGVREEPDRPLLATLGEQLKSRSTLLILDNCEHLVQASALLASALLQAAPGVRLLASSRESLRVPGEQVYPVLPLSVPQGGEGVAGLLGSTAVRLFVDRARLHRPDFELGEREAPAVAELVARLEGIPLALELAAARVRSLGIVEINARLKNRYKLLTGGSRVVLPRQQTLRSLVDWSYELLSPGEQRLLERLSVFVGGFDLAAAEAVCAGGDVEVDDVLDLLGTLVDKSMVLLESRDDNERYRLLETIRDYAAEKLAQRTDVGELAARHCHYYFALAKDKNNELRGPRQAEAVWKLERELDNIRSAIGLSMAGGVDPFIAVKFAVSLQAFWILRGYGTEGRKLVASLLGTPAVQASTLATAWALYVGAALAESQSDHAEARRMLEACLALRRTLGQQTEIAATLSTLSLARLKEGDVEAALAGEAESLDIFRSLGDTRGEGFCLLHLGQIHLYTGDPSAARASLEQALEIARRIRHQEFEAECELTLGELDFDHSDASEGRGELRFKRSLMVCREAGDRRGEANALLWLGRVALASGDTSAARERLTGALRAFQSFEMRDELLACLDVHAELNFAEGRQALAVDLSRAAELNRGRLGLKRPPRREASWQRHLETLANLPPDAKAQASGAATMAWEIEDAVRSALTAITAPAVDPLVPKTLAAAA